MLQDQRDPHVLRPESHARSGCVRRGNLRLFFGGCAGLTAVRTMLETAKAARQTGIDVVVGRVNFCGRGTIDRLLCDFECLPALNAAAGGGHPTRIDLDIVRKRVPKILLVDTSSLPEADHASRSVHNHHYWADIEDVIASGIDVWAALDATGFSSWTSVGVGAPPRTSALSLL